MRGDSQLDLDALFSGLVSFGGSNGDWGFVDNQHDETGDALGSGSYDGGP
jgi:hypothetical protein